MKKILSLCTKIYNVHNSRECRRMFVFFFRSLANRKRMRGMFDFFDGYSLNEEVLSKSHFCFEQITRQFFYKNSNCEERCNLIKDHFNFLADTFSGDAVKSMYEGNGIEIWQDTYEEKKLSIVLRFERGQKKEGLLSVILDLDERHLYQIIFWIAKDKKSDCMALWIGALQGFNDDNAIAVIKGLTKYFHGYRTKNLILYAVRAVVRVLNIDTIYAVSNKGFYTNNHIRLDRKLKTSLDDFWQETGGTLTDDYRFFELPVNENRKSLEEVKPHKRNLYRKRFEKLDGMETVILSAVDNYIK